MNAGEVATGAPSRARSGSRLSDRGVSIRQVIDSDSATSSLETERCVISPGVAQSVIRSGAAELCAASMKSRARLTH